MIHFVIMIEIRKFIKNKEFKRCSKCNKYLLLDSNHFWKSSASIDGFHNYCKDCNKKQRREYYKKYPEKDFNNNMKRLYGITYKEYLIIEKEQNYRCAICNLTLEETGTRYGRGKAKHFHIDHDHNTGKIRGLLCVRCNQGIGSLKHNPFILINAIKYLKKPSCPYKQRGKRSKVWFCSIENYRNCSRECDSNFESCLYYSNKIKIL